MTRSRGGRPISAVILATALLATLTAATGAGTAGAASCEPTPNVLSGKPVTTLKLPKKASARVWDTGRRSRRIDEVRVAAVTIPKASLIPRVRASEGLSGLQRPYQLASKHTVALINGSVWDEWSNGVPVRAQILGGVLRKGESTPSRALAVYAKTRSLAVAQMSVRGTATVTRGQQVVETIRIGAVNWQTLSTAGATMYTPAWGDFDHPVGRRTIVVAGGRVTAVLSGNEDGAAYAPPSNAIFLTARWVGAASDQIDSVRVGDKVAVSVAPAGVLQYGPKGAPIGRPTGLTGLSAPVVENGKVVFGCDSVSEIRRPRSLIGWKRNGDVLLVAISGREFDGELRVGGATVHQAAEYLRRLGAVTAVAFDGGNSTTLLVRKKPKGRLIRLDRSGSEYQRPITDALSFDLQ